MSLFQSFNKRVDTIVDAVMSKIPSDHKEDEALEMIYECCMRLEKSQFLTVLKVAEIKLYDLGYNPILQLFRSTKITPGDDKTIYKVNIKIAKRDMLEDGFQIILVDKNGNSKVIYVEEKHSSSSQDNQNTPEKS